jgi:hypothetical protein
MHAVACLLQDGRTTETCSSISSIIVKLTYDSCVNGYKNPHHPINILLVEDGLTTETYSSGVINSKTYCNNVSQTETLSPWFRLVFKIVISGTEVRSFVAPAKRFKLDLI